MIGGRKSVGNNGHKQQEASGAGGALKPNPWKELRFGGEKV